LHLVGHARLLHGIFRDVHSDFVEDEHLAMGNPGGDGNALVHTFARLERLGHEDYLTGNPPVAKKFFRNSQKFRREGGTGRLKTGHLQGHSEVIYSYQVSWSEQAAFQFLHTGWLPVAAPLSGAFLMHLISIS
jgi:hypothetical protein